MVKSNRLRPFAPNPQKYKKIIYPNGQNGYQYRNQKFNKFAGGAVTGQKSETSFAESDFKLLNKDEDDKYKDIHCNITFESISLEQTSDEDGRFEAFNFPLDDEQ